ncbi:hypothetical protein J2X10_001755 [Pseudomonas peli]|nr:hypothetical protein [Pseudomonas peli]
MALSPAKRHFLRTTAAIEAAAAAGPSQTMEGATAYEHQLAQLAQHRLRLKQVQSTQGKASLKALLLPEYVPYVQGVLEAGNGAQDEVLTTVMLWRIDAADYPGALEVAEYVIKHNLKMPDRFERTTGTLIAEEIAEAALKAQKAGESFPLSILEQAARITAEQDMPDQARAKLHLAIGKALAGSVSDEGAVGIDLLHLEQAKQHLAKAIDLHSNCGGKKDLERVDRLLKKHAVPPVPPATTEIQEPPAPPVSLDTPPPPVTLETQDNPVPPATLETQEPQVPPATPETKKLPAARKPRPSRKPKSPRKPR